MDNPFSTHHVIQSLVTMHSFGAFSVCRSRWPRCVGRWRIREAACLSYLGWWLVCLDHLSHIVHTITCTSVRTRTACSTHILAHCHHSTAFARIHAHARTRAYMRTCVIHSFMHEFPHNPNWDTLDLLIHSLIQNHFIHIHSLNKFSLNQFIYLIKLDLFR